MGSKNSKSKNYTISMNGLDGAGKASMIKYLQSQDQNKSNPHDIPNVVFIKYKGVDLTIYKVGGKNSYLRKLFKEKMDAVIFVVDSLDKDKFEDGAKELETIVHEDNMVDSAILLFANKQDLNGAFPPGEVTNNLRMGQLKGRTWLCQGCNSLSGEGVDAGLD